MVMWIKALIVAGSMVVGLASVYIFKGKPDNKVEETAEMVIKTVTDGKMDIDLSPATPEGDQKSEEAGDNK
jgi:hypothetical protein